MSSAVITLAGNFPRDDDKQAAALALHQRLSAPNVRYHGQPGSPTQPSDERNPDVVTRDEIITLLNDIPFPARVQFILKSVCPSAIRDEVVASLYNVAFKVYNSQDSVKTDEVVESAAERDSLDLDWEFLTSLDLCQSSESRPPSPTVTVNEQGRSPAKRGAELLEPERSEVGSLWEPERKRARAERTPSRADGEPTSSQVSLSRASMDALPHSSNDPHIQPVPMLIDSNHPGLSSAPSTTSDQSLKVMVGAHFPLLELLVTTLPQLEAAGSRIFEDYISCNGQRYRQRILNAMISSPLIADQSYLDAMKSMPPAAVARCLRAWAPFRSLRINLFDALIKKHFLQNADDEAQTDCTLGSSELLRESGVMASRTFKCLRWKFLRWDLHGELYSQWIKDRLVECGDDVLARGDFVTRLCSVIEPCAEANAFILASVLQYPAFSISSGEPREISEKLRAMVQRGELTEPHLCKHLRYTSIPQRIVSGITSAAWGELIAPYVQETPDEGLVINNDAALRILAELVASAKGKHMQERLQHWFLPLAVRCFELTPPKLLASPDYLSWTEASDASRALRTGALFADFYKKFLCMRLRHVDVSALALAWSKMHLRVVDQDLAPAMDTAARHKFWAKWYANCTVSLPQTLEFRINELQRKSRDVVSETKQPSSLVSVYGLVDILFSISQKAWEKWKQESLNLTADPAVEWWRCPDVSEGLYTALSNNLLVSIKAAGKNIYPADKVHPLRNLSRDSTSLAPQLLAALRSEIDAARLETLDENHLWMQRFSEALWHIGMQRVFPGDDDAQLFYNYSSTCLTGFQKGATVSELEGGKVSYLWNKDTLRFLKIPARRQASMFQLFKSTLERNVKTSDGFANCPADYKLRNFDVLCKLLESPTPHSASRTFWTSADQSEYLSLLCTLPADVRMSELDHTIALIDSVLTTDVQRAYKLFQIIDNDQTKGASAFSEAVMAALLANPTSREIILKETHWWVRAPISLPYLREHHSARKSAEPEERATFYLDMLNASLKATPQDLAQTLELIRKRTRNERGTVTREIYTWVFRNADKWLGMTLRLDGQAALEVSAMQVKTLLEMIETDLQRRDSVARSCLSGLPRRILDNALRTRFRNEATFAALQAWVDFAVHVDWVFIGARDGDKGLETYLWCDKLSDDTSTEWTKQLVKAEGPGYEELAATYAHFLERVPRRRELLFGYLVAYGSHVRRTDGAGSPVTPAQCVDMLKTALAKAKQAEYDLRAYSKEDRSWLLDPVYDVSKGLVDRAELDRICSLFDIVGSRWHEVPELVSILESVTQSVRDCAATTTDDPVQIELARELLRFVRKRQALWFCVPQLQALGEALFTDAVERCRPGSKLAETPVLLEDHCRMLDHWEEIQYQKPLANTFQSEEFFKSPVHRALFLEAFRVKDLNMEGRLARLLKVPAPDKAQIASALFQICPTSAIHVPLVRHVLETERTDLLTPFLTDESCTFLGPLERMQPKRTETRCIEPQTFRRAVGFMTGQQAALIGEDILRTAMSPAGSLEVKQKAMEQYAGWPTLDYKSYIDLMVRLRDAEQPSQLLETIILRSFDHDSCVVILSFLLSAENIAKSPQRVLVLVLERLPAIFRPEQFADLLALLLANGERRNAIRVVFHKAIGRMLLASKESTTAARLLENEWNNPTLHEDVRIEYFTQCLTLVCAHEGKLAVQSYPVVASAWKIVDDACARPNMLPLSTLSEIVRLSYQSPAHHQRPVLDVHAPAVRYDIPEWVATEPNEDREDEKQFNAIQGHWIGASQCVFKHTDTRDRMVRNLSKLWKSLSADTDGEARGFGFICFLKMLFLSRHLSGEAVNDITTDEEAVVSTLDKEMDARFTQRLTDPVSVMKRRIYPYIDQSTAELLGLACAASLRRRVVVSSGIVAYLKSNPADASVVLLQRHYKRHIHLLLHQPAFLPSEDEGDTSAVMTRLMARQAAYVTLGSLKQGFRRGVRMYFSVGYDREGEEFVEELMELVLGKRFAKRMAVLRREAEGVGRL
ncbi:uncharacterized protein EV422DRAFT_340470 [Fimicolochytrium jonesii]|uniref:uncharacterized protein n=1 Tax=Fimicolochytrium jonesii TaxID=1396493 RepID=UPI0022FE0E95|nr:uncharacterized protein EV422DRAFT_340470 [Fimicolochytrium jonesii]KAI8815896.1 hypothetical protein EV422DRAFT_340470 [Fimicolochytrium jonesii]